MKFKQKDDMESIMSPKKTQVVLYQKDDRGNTKMCVTHFTHIPPEGALVWINEKKLFRVEKVVYNFLGCSEHQSQETVCLEPAIWLVEATAEEHELYYPPGKHDHTTDRDDCIDNFLRESWINLTCVLNNLRP